MRDGFIKVAVGTPEIRVADSAFNGAAVCELMQKAQRLGVKLLVLPELCLTGYTCGDLFLQPTLLEGAAQALKRVCAASVGLSMLTVAGLPFLYGGKLYNCAAVVYEGRVLGIVPKTWIPNYGEFYEQRHFAGAPEDNGKVSFDGQEIPFGARMLFCCREMPELCLAAEICEDLWSVCPPSVGHAAAGATVIANLSASDELVGKSDYRRSLVSGQSARLVCAYLYADAGEGESTTDMVFSGHSMVAENGAVVAQSVPFSAGLTVTEIDLQRICGERQRMTTFPACRDEGYEKISFSMALCDTALSRPVSSQPFIPADPQKRESSCEEILQIQAHGLKKRISHSRARTVVVGISGGLDSALALLVGVRALELLGRPRTCLLAVTMPCFGTTARTKGNAQLLCESLGVSFMEVDIKAAVDAHFADIGQDCQNYDVTYENAQARERTQVLMDLANQRGGLVLGTGDLSELALGWATYNGDHMSMYGVNASVPKTLVRHLVAYEAHRCGEGPTSRALLDILDTPVSPELLPADKDGGIAQKTEDLVGPYELHDFFLYYAIRWAFSPEKVLRLAKYAFAGEYDEKTIRYWLKNFYRRFFAQQFKRSCLPDGPKVGTVTLSPRGDWRMPSDALSTLWLSQLEE